ncbi:hypothetical protein [Leptolyngbya sp. GGD]|uniref:hypothetical protein n=1 Tax=Leptolyngbya sp. GGD TaxID=2997907 RepID=UPI00227CFD97|nr:hypothetical protein [Leptolyngbya sp. GGD]MCY6494331.1 hypothetical protein [Leptolyngbya sp. GGD]
MDDLDLNDFGPTVEEQLHALLDELEESLPDICEALQDAWNENRNTIRASYELMSRFRALKTQYCPSVVFR